jgi:hypothetical protein
VGIPVTSRIDATRSRGSKVRVILRPPGYVQTVVFPTPSRSYVVAGPFSVSWRTFDRES